MNILVVPHVFIPQDVETNVLGKINFKLVNYELYYIKSFDMYKKNGISLIFHAISEYHQRTNPLVTNRTSIQDIESRGTDPLFPRRGITMEIPKCKCSKLIPYPRKDDDGLNDFKSRPINKKDTLCEDYAFVRGPGQNVVAFTFYEPPVQVSLSMPIFS